VTYPTVNEAYGIWNLNDISNADYVWPYNFIEILCYGGGGAGGTVGGWSYGAVGGTGGYAGGRFVWRPEPVTFYVVVGAGGRINQQQYFEGGGGIANRDGLLGTDNRYGGGGGGYSGVFLTNFRSQASALVIAGGGGGGGSSTSTAGNVGGSGGGLTGVDGTSAVPAYAGKGGTQIAAGVNATCDSPADTNGFQGALRGGSCLVNGYGGAGGGGYWGGSAGGYYSPGHMGGGGGGSSFVNTRFITNTSLTSAGGSVGGNASQNGTNGTVVFRYKGQTVKANSINGGITYIDTEENTVSHIFSYSVSSIDTTLSLTSITFSPWQ